MVADSGADVNSVQGESLRLPPGAGPRPVHFGPKVYKFSLSPSLHKGETAHSGVPELHYMAQYALIWPESIKTYFDKSAFLYFPRPEIVNCGLSQVKHNCPLDQPYLLVADCPGSAVDLPEHLD